ncbi:MAG: DUF2110 family protein [Haloarculaceae archaeon]
MVVLATKCYVGGEARERAMDSLGSQVANELGELDVKYDVGLREDEFPTVTVSGPDETVARNVLAEAWGELTPQTRPGEVAVGTLDSWDDAGFVLDVGFGDSVRVPADEIGLGQGTPEQVRTRFGLVQHVPLRYVAGDGGTGSADHGSETDAGGVDDRRSGDAPRLADEERDRLYEWTRGNGRVNVNSATRSEVRATVNRAGHAEDIVTVERLGLLEQSIVCRDGTDPPGLLASIGEYLPAELLCVVP